MATNRGRRTLFLALALAVGGVSCGDDSTPASVYCEARCSILARCDDAGLENTYGSVSACEKECIEAYAAEPEGELAEQPEGLRDAWQRCWDLELTLDLCVYDNSTCEEWLDSHPPEPCWDDADEAGSCWDEL